AEGEGRAQSPSSVQRLSGRHSAPRVHLWQDLVARCSARSTTERPSCREEAVGRGHWYALVDSVICWLCCRPQLAPLSFSSNHPHQHLSSLQVCVARRTSSRGTSR